MEVYMELSKKTTILFSPDLHERLTRLAEQRGTSIGDLVRTAVERQYGLVSEDERLAAVDALGELDLPVGTPEQMEAESVPPPEEILP
jgi:predicted DNA-binding protein